MTQSTHHGFEHVFATTLGGYVQDCLALISTKDKISSLQCDRDEDKFDLKKTEIRAVGKGRILQELARGNY